MKGMSSRTQSPKSPKHSKGFMFDDKENFEVKDFNSFAPPVLKQDGNQSAERFVPYMFVSIIEARQFCKNRMCVDDFSIGNRKKRRRRSSFNRRVSFSHTVDVRLFEKSDEQWRPPSKLHSNSGDTYPHNQ
jgi:hypothetical protein